MAAGDPNPEASAAAGDGQGAADARAVKQPSGQVVEGDGNQLLSQVSAARDLTLGDSVAGDKVTGDKVSRDKIGRDKIEIVVADAQQAADVARSLKHKKPIERFKEALEMTDRGWQLLDSDHAKSLELFDNAKKCYEKLPEPYVMSGIWQMNNQKYDAALVSFKYAKILYEQIESLYDGIDDNDLREANLDIKKDRIAQKCEEIARIDTYIKNVNTLMKTPFPLRNLRNLFMNCIMISNKI
jgi:hypothetical protein